MAPIPEKYRDLLERPVIVALATVLESGQPQVHPVWADLEGEYIRINTVAGRAKHRNMEERPLVTVLAVDPDDPFRWLEVRGKVEKTCFEGADAHIDKLAKEYMGVDVYPGHTPENKRLIAYVKPTRVIASG